MSLDKSLIDLKIGSPDDTVSPLKGKFGQLATQKSFTKGKNDGDFKKEMAARTYW